MAKTDRELAEILKNMEAMGWPMKLGHAPDTVVVYGPSNHPPFTVSLKTNRGDGKRDALTLIRRSGYFEAWEQHNKIRQTVGAISDQEDAEIVGIVAEAVSAVIDSIIIPNQPASPEDTVADATPATVNINRKPATDRNHFEGVEIVSRGPAKAPVPTSNGVPVEVKGVEEILLADERIMYRCVRSARCFFTADRVASVVSHLPTHGTATRAARDDAKSARYSAGAKAGHEARMERLAALAELGPSEALANLAGILTDSAQVARDLAKLTANLDNAELDALRAEVEQLREQVAQLGARPDIEPAELEAIRTKAAKWDALASAMRD